MHRLKSALVVLLLIIAVGCGTGRGKNFYQKGIASWYGKSFHGLPTASGEPFNMYDMTAAHKKLPLGTVVRVYCPETDRWITVRINDRGPFIRGRVIDLSYAAAKKLGIHIKGIAEVLIYTQDRVVQPDRPVEKRAVSYYVQVGAFESEHNAQNLKDKLEDSFPSVILKKANGYTRVLVGPFRSESEANEAADRLRSSHDVIIRTE